MLTHRKHNLKRAYDVPSASKVKKMHAIFESQFSKVACTFQKLRATFLQQKLRALFKSCVQLFKSQFSKVACNFSKVNFQKLRALFKSCVQLFKSCVHFSKVACNFFLLKSCTQLLLLKSLNF